MSTGKTDLETIKKTAESMLDIELKINKKYKNRFIHPFFNDVIYGFPAPDGKYNVCVLVEGDTEDNSSSSDMFNVIDYPEGLKVAKERMRVLLKEADSVMDVFLYICKSYRFLFLELVKHCLSCDDLSEVMEHIWIDSENTSRYNAFSKAELVKLFRSCNPTVLMGKEDYEYYQNLPDEITIYRGIIEFSEKGIYGLSWTLSLEQAIWFANRFAFLYENEEKAVYKAKIKKKDVLAYFSGEEEIVVNPKKLYDVKRYEEC